MATTAKGHVCISFYNIHLPTGCMPHMAWIEQLQDIAADIKGQETLKLRSMFVVGGDWNVVAADIWGAETDSERHGHLRLFLCNSGLVVRARLDWEGSALATTSVWTPGRQDAPREDLGLLRFVRGHRGEHRREGPPGAHPERPQPGVVGTGCTS